VVDLPLRIVNLLWCSFTSFMASAPAPPGTAAVQARADARAAELAPIVAEPQAAGATSLRAIAAGLNARGVRPPRGVGEWKVESVTQLLARLPGVSPPRYIFCFL
jgi:hypothetical protein